MNLFNANMMSIKKRSAQYFTIVNDIFSDRKLTRTVDDTYGNCFTFNFVGENADEMSEKSTRASSNFGKYSIIKPVGCFIIRGHMFSKMDMLL